METVNIMKAQGAQSLRCRKALSKIIQRHEKAFANFRENCDEILSELCILIRKLTVYTYVPNKNFFTIMYIYIFIKFTI